MLVVFKKRLFSYDNFITDEKLFRATTGLEIAKFKFYMNIWIPEKIVKILNTMNLLQEIRKKIGQMLTVKDRS